MSKIGVKTFIILLILLFGFLVRLYGFTNPIADWHSWRQADTSSVSRNFVDKGFDLLHPTYQDLSNVPSGHENPQGYRFVEFPLYNALQAGLFVIFHRFTLEEWGRIITIFASLVSTIFIYLLVKKYLNSTAGIFSAFFYTFLPYNIYYGRVILPDPSMVAAVLSGVYFFDKWLEAKEKKKKIIFYVLAIVSTTSALLLKPYAIFFMLPMLYIAWQKFGLKMILRWQLWLFCLIAPIPLILWRIWMTQYPEGIPVSAWLLNGNGIRFRPAFFRWIVYERLIKLIAGYIGVLLLFLGTYRIFRIKHTWFFLSFFTGSILYVTIFATGNVQHDYYQILIMPTTAIVFGIGADYLFSLKKEIKGISLGKSALVILTISAFYFSWQQVKDYFNINNRSIVIAGNAVDKLIPKDAKIIANLTGDTSFLYQTRRSGWASFEHPIPEMVKLGASYLVLVNPTDEDLQLGKTYKIVSKTDKYVLFKLK